MRKMERVAFISILLTMFILVGAPLTSGVAAEPVIGSTTTTLHPIADAYVDSESPDTNFGSEGHLDVVSNSIFSYAYVMFDLSSIPRGANIISAQLGLYLASTGGDIYGLPADKIGAYSCPDISWPEQGITWNNKPSFASKPTDTWSFSLFYTYKNYKSWDVTDDVKAAATVGRLTEVLKFTTKTNYGYARFESNEEANKPRLEVEYSVESIHDVLLESAQDIGATENLGYITVADEAFSLPADVPVVAGSYEVTYHSGYSFLRWETSGGVSVSQEYDRTTTLTVSGTGKLRAVGSGETVEYAYDDGTAEYSASKKSGQMVAVRFTPLLSDKLTTVRIYIRYVSSNASKNRIKIHVMDANRIDLIAPITQTPTSEGWFDVDLSGYGLAATANQDFYVAVEWTADYSPNIGGDRGQPDERSWYWDGTSWNVDKNYDYQFRVVAGKVQSTITCWPSPITTTIGSDVTVSGSIHPPRGGVEVTLTYARPDGTPVTRTVTTADSGSYTDVFTSDILGSWSVYASSVGDETFTAAKSLQASFTVTKASSTISCLSSPSVIAVDESVTIKGSISPPRPAVPVHLQHRIEGEEAWEDIVFVTSDTAGSYSYTWTSASIGEQEVRASWDGDEAHHGAESDVITVTVTKKPSAISCSPSKGNIEEDESITVSGSISPPMGGVTLTLIYTAPDGTTLTREATTAEGGTYSDMYNPEKVGSWSVKASWDGDEKHAGAESPPASFEVLEKKRRPCFIATATYGSELASEVNFLRGFRDLKILSTFAGSQFMNVFDSWYYSFSPRVASAIVVNDVLRVIMKIFLYPLIGILHLAATTYSLLGLNPEFAVVVSGWIASSLIGLVYLGPCVLLSSLFRKIRAPVMVIHIQSVFWISSIGGITIADVIRLPGLMMLSTAMFVLTSMCLSVLIFKKLLEEALT